jgi:hypothetical protein
VLTLLVLAALGGVGIACGDSASEDAAADDGGDAPVPSVTAPTHDASAPPPENDGGTLDASFLEDAGAPTPDPGDQCLDGEDPGATAPAARVLPDLDDCDSSGPGYGGHPPITGVMNGADDVDLYKFVGKDTFGCNVGPVLVSPTSGLEVCMFVACSKGSTNFKKCTGGAQTTSDIGDPGCCVTTPAETQLDFSCGGFTQTDDTATFFIRVKQTANLCLPYQFAFHD